MLFLTPQKYNNNQEIHDSDQITWNLIEIKLTQINIIEEIVFQLQFIKLRSYNSLRILFSIYALIIFIAKASRKWFNALERDCVRERENKWPYLSLEAVSKLL